jgi:trans-aconitate 2-methyltransferase
MAPRDWDAASYQRVSAPQEAMGREVLDRLELRGDERVLDAGCGTGRVTAALLERLQHGQVVAVDGSPAMVAEARERLGPRADVRVADLTELELETPVDAILSTATFHWIADHDRLFERLFAALRPGGRIVAQCGGAGNVAAVQAAVDAVAEPALAGWRGPWHFASPEETAERLLRLGFTDVRTWRQDVRVEPENPREYLATVVLGSHLERVPAERRDAFADAVLARLPEPVIDYVRLNIAARRPA